MTHDFYHVGCISIKYKVLLVLLIRALVLMAAAKYLINGLKTSRDN